MANEPLLGAIFLFAGNFAPNGYQLCNGQIVSISQFTALFSILGTTYGGNGVTTFALPDLRGRAPVGYGQGPGLSNYVEGQTLGKESVTLTSANVPAAPAHTHSINVSTAAAAQTNPQNNFLAAVVDSSGGPSTGYNTAATAGATLNTASVNPASGPAGGSTPVDIRQPVLAISYIIATQGIFPSRQ